MTDLALVWDADAMAADLLLGSGRLATDDGMRTAILISLFTDARAADDETLPEAGGDRRGWWGDAYAREPRPDAGTARDPDRIGSLLWLLSRSKITPRTLAQAKQACDEALAWLVRDGIASAVRVVIEAQVRPGQSTPDLMAIAVEIDRPTGPNRQRHDFTWDASTATITAHPEPA
ncbi:MAG: phage GP46 family protein [Erythrobacter sp.]|uniref:phage GP46 family protein n=1 Tax=Erythrobacter sp. TaxID=1042 RepID=UPI0025F2F43D|nr:phage GP46 family protein [Erythrobacter sp.]MCL9999230.1 phage GP46 family protein [Erythrobacter sp.]